MGRTDDIDRSAGWFGPRGMPNFHNIILVPCLHLHFAVLDFQNHFNRIQHLNMLSLASIQPVLLPIVLGVATHLAVFIRGEWHMQAPFLFKLYALVYVGSFAVLRCFPASFNNFYLTTNTFFLYYMSGLFSSICIYRRYFHRLRHFPGPPLAGITKFWHVWQCRTGQNYLVIEKLRKKYGPVIRTGPEELTIIDAAVPSAVDGPKSKCTKAVWYDFLLPEIAVNTTRSNKEHDARRRIWDQGFSTKALAAYDERVVQYTDTLVRRIESTSQRSEAVNVSDWFYWYTFDIMGEFAFARSFSMLEEENWHFAVKLLRKAMSLLGPFSPVPWAAQIAFYIVPWMYIVRDWLAMMEWCKDRMGERIKVCLPTAEYHQRAHTNSDESGSDRCIALADRRIIKKRLSGSR